jgi:hypothetical protein
MSESPPAPPADRLPDDELFVLCTWAVQAVAAELRISEDDAYEAMAAAEAQGRVQVLGTSMFAGVQVDDRWVVVEGRARITQATHEWVTLRNLEHDLQ